MKMGLKCLSHDFHLIPLEMYLMCLKQFLFRHGLSVELEAIFGF